MDLMFKEATQDDADIIASQVIQLTEEICERTDEQHFDIDLDGTTKRCKELLAAGCYAAIICYCNTQPIGIATMTETYALYAGGKIGIIQEFYVAPTLRSSGVGAMLIDQVEKYGQRNDWSCIELCTPPLPEFERALDFYQDNGLIPVGGRKMRKNL